LELGQAVKINNAKGFTLAELMIVIALIAIMSSIASFSWMRYVNNANLQTAARELQSDMANAKQRAVAEGVNYRITITAGTPGNYTIEQGNAIDSTFAEIATKIPTANGAGLYINSTNIIDFQPRGTNSAGTVVLQNSRGSSATITSNITGKTYVTFSMQ
jgi:prepilin-type N-terminal cleavage/methylation domain-containing protein